MSRGRPLSPILRDAFAHQGELRAEFALVRSAAYDRAEEATRGRMVNRRGMKAGVSGWALFRCNGAMAAAYASPELLEHWQKYPRLTFPEYEMQRYDSPVDNMALDPRSVERSYHQ